MPAATTLLVEEPGDYLPDRQTLWPRSKLCRVRCGGPTLTALGDLAERHAKYQLLDHLFGYDGAEALPEFHDAFMHDSVAFLSADTDEQLIRRFAEVFRLEMTHAEPD